MSTSTRVSAPRPERPRLDDRLVDRYLELGLLQWGLGVRLKLTNRRATGRPRVAWYSKKAYTALTAPAMAARDLAGSAPCDSTTLPAGCSSQRTNHGEVIDLHAVPGQAMPVQETR